MTVIQVLKTAIRRLDKKTREDIKILNRPGFCSISPVDLVTMSEDELMNKCYYENHLYHMCLDARKELLYEIGILIDGKEGSMANDITVNTQIEAPGSSFDVWLKNVLGNTAGSAEWQESYNAFKKSMEEHYAGGSIDKVRVEDIFPTGTELKSSLDDEDLGKKAKKIKNNWKHIDILYDVKQITPVYHKLEADEKKIEKKKFEDKKYGDLEFHW